MVHSRKVRIYRVYIYIIYPIKARRSAAALTFLQTSLCGGEHLINSEGVRSLFDAFILHLLNVWQAVHGTAEISLPRLWIWTVYAWLVFTYA